MRASIVTIEPLPGRSAIKEAVGTAVLVVDVDVRRSAEIGHLVRDPDEPVVECEFESAFVLLHLLTKLANKAIPRKPSRIVVSPESSAPRRLRGYAPLLSTFPGVHAS